MSSYVIYNFSFVFCYIWYFVTFIKLLFCNFKEEWEFLKQQGSQKPFSNSSSETTSVASGDEGSLEETQENASLSQGTEQQRVFVELVAATARQLFSYM